MSEGDKEAAQVMPLLERLVLGTMEGNTRVTIRKESPQEARNAGNHGRKNLGSGSEGVNK